MPNWLDGERRDILKAQCVNPTSFGHVGWLSVTDADLTESYYSDTRIQGTLTAIDTDNFVPLSMIRLIHEATFGNGETYKKTLGTFFALRPREVWKDGMLKTEFELKSVLYGMKDDLAPFDMTVASGSTTQAVYNKICSDCNRQRLWISGAKDHKFTHNTVLEAMDSYLSWLHLLADVSGNRLDCDELGRVTMSAYTAPSRRTSIMRLAYNSPLVLSSGITRSSDDFEVASRSIVTWTNQYTVRVKDGSRYIDKTEHRPITAYADVDAGDQASINRRGYRISVLHTMDDLGDSKAVAEKYAKSFLADDSKPIVEWSIRTRWFEIHEGDVISWKPSESEGYRNVLVSEVEKDLNKFKMELTLKEV